MFPWVFLMCFHRISEIKRRPFCPWIPLSTMHPTPDCITFCWLDPALSDSSRKYVSKNFQSLCREFLCAQIHRFVIRAKRFFMSSLNHLKPRGLLEVKLFWISSLVIKSLLFLLKSTVILLTIILLLPSGPFLSLKLLIQQTKVMAQMYVETRKSVIIYLAQETP